LALAKVADIYKRAREGGYGVGGFCINDPGMAIAILRAAEETHSPVVTVIAQGSIRSVGEGYLEAIVKHGASQVDVPRYRFRDLPAMYYEWAFFSDV
jgi:fructose/tagatose bisphosphate aldolase